MIRHSPTSKASLNACTTGKHSLSRCFDVIAKLMTDAAGAAQDVQQDPETMFSSQAEKILRDVVQREEFEVVKAMAAKALDENERLSRE